MDYMLNGFLVETEEPGDESKQERMLAEYLNGCNKKEGKDHDE